MYEMIFALKSAKSGRFPIRSASPTWLSRTGFIARPLQFAALHMYPARTRPQSDPDWSRSRRWSLWQDAPPFLFHSQAASVYGDVLSESFFLLAAQEPGTPAMTTKSEEESNVRTGETIHADYGARGTGRDAQRGLYRACWAGRIPDMG